MDKHKIIEHINTLYTDWNGSQIDWCNFVSKVVNIFYNSEKEILDEIRSIIDYEDEGVDDDCSCNECKIKRIKEYIELKIKE